MAVRGRQGRPWNPAGMNGPIDNAAGENASLEQCHDVPRPDRTPAVVSSLVPAPSAVHADRRQLPVASSQLPRRQAERQRIAMPQAAELLNILDHLSTACRFTCWPDRPLTCSVCDQSHTGSISQTT